MEIPISKEVFEGKKLFFATPMYGGMCLGTFSRSVSDLSQYSVPLQLPINFHFLFNESLITRARNYCCDEFLRSDATHMIFVDSDIGFDPKDVLSMLSLQIRNKEYDILGGAYPKKCIAWEKIKKAVDNGYADNNAEELSKYVGDFVLNFKQGTDQINMGEPVEVLELGTGFLMFSKETLIKFRDAYPQYAFRPDHVRTKQFDGSRLIHQFFQAEIDKIDDGAFWKSAFDYIKNAKDMNEIKDIIESAETQFPIEANKFSLRYLSEDYWFCQKAQKIGLKVWLCPWIRLQHTGTMVFGGSLLDLAQAGLPFTADTRQLKKG